MKKGTLILIAIIAILGITTCSTQRSLVTQDENVKASWGEVENQYQRRNDLIGNLVETVKGYATHEQTTLTEVVNARANATKININIDDLTDENIAKFQQAQSQVRGSFDKLMAVVESYPDLKANQSFLKLQDELAGTENRVATARGRFNETVKEYNTYVRKFPTNILAGVFGFQTKASFKAEAGAEKPVEVKF